MTPRPCCIACWAVAHPRPPDDVYLLEQAQSLASQWDDAVFDMRWAGLRESHDYATQPPLPGAGSAAATAHAAAQAAAGGPRGDYLYWYRQYIQTGDPADLEQLLRQPLPDRPPALPGDKPPAPPIQFPDAQWMTTEPASHAGIEPLLIAILIAGCVALLVMVLL